jgi:hypothetical protein
VTPGLATPSKSITVKLVEAGSPRETKNLSRNGQNLENTHKVEMSGKIDPQT